MAIACRTHGLQRIEQQRTQPGAIERRFEPARAQEHGELPAHLAVDRAREQAPVFEDPQQERQERPQIPLAPPLRPRLGREQPLDVDLVQPQVRDGIERQIMRECTRQDHPVDAPRGRARDHIHDHAQIETAATQHPQCLEIHALRGVGTPVRTGAAVHMGLVLLDLLLGSRVICPRGPHEIEDLLRDAVLVDGERHATEADERDTQLLLLGGRGITTCCARMVHLVNDRRVFMPVQRPAGPDANGSTIRLQSRARGPAGPESMDISAARH